MTADMSQPIIQVTTHPFGECGSKPRQLLEETGWEVRYNPFGRRLKLHEARDLMRDVHGVIAGTEPYTREFIEQAPNLRVISRVGVGLDNVDYNACVDRGITVTFTPEAPADAVAELTVAQILNLLRRVHESDRSVREGAWNRYLGSLVREVTIGIVGVGRIGKRVVKLLQPFQPRILACDLQPDREFGERYNLTWVDLPKLLQQSDIVTLHVPLNDRNRGLISRDQLAQMKPGSMLVNFSRGKVVDESALENAIRRKHLGGAALDVFEDEPYEGTLTRFPNVVLTAHIGASARQSRYQMELQAVENCVDVLAGREPAFRVTAFDCGLVSQRG